MHRFSAPSLRLLCSAHNCIARVPFVCFTAAVLLLLGGSALGYAQDFNAATVHPKAPVHIMKRATSPPDSSLLRAPLKARVAPQDQPRANTGSGIVFTCDPNVDATQAGTCNYLNTTFAGWYNSTFTNANASIYIQYGTTGLGQSTSGFYNFVTYDQYVAALTANTNKSAVQTSALSALSTYAATPYGSDYVNLTNALGSALGISGMVGTTLSQTTCTPFTANCYNGIITVTNTPGTFYYDNVGGGEGSDLYDFYGVVSHETDEVLGTASCIDTQSGPNLVDDCDAAAPAGGPGSPSAVDLYRYSSAGELVLDSSLSQTAGAYFSYNGGTTNGANGKAGTPKVYNTISNGADYADFLSSSPDCGTDIAVQDAYGCPGEDAGLTILNDGGGEIHILNAVGYDIPSTTPAKAVLTAPTPGTPLGTSNVQFTWTAGNEVTEYQIWIGLNGPGSSNLYVSGWLTAPTATTTVTSLPETSATIYVRLYSNVGGKVQYNDYTYTGTGTAATISSPAQGSQLAATDQEFQFTVPNDVTEVNLWLGNNGAGSSDLYVSGWLMENSVIVPKLPAHGATVYARLYSMVGGKVVSNDYTYTEAP